VAALAAATIAAGAMAGATGASPTPRPSAGQAARAENGFALRLLSQLGSNGNVVYSPFSIATALAMADAGAEGATATQIATALGAASPSAAVADAGAVNRAIATAAGHGRQAPALDIANALWAQRGLAIEPAFRSILASSFGAPPMETDFETAPQAALQTINAWVSAHTAKIIPSLLPPGSVSAGTRFVLANAIYLKALWQSPFDPRATRSLPFTTATGQRVSVPFMSSTEVQYPYGAGADYQAVDLPYRSASLGLLAVLPVGRTLAQFERTLTAGSLAQIVGGLTSRSVTLEFPKLHLHTQTGLNQVLEALGIRSAFTPAADFAGITRAAQLRIGLVEHAADLRIDEQGTVATGATAITLPTAAMPVSSRVAVTLDRPFLLFLYDERSGAILFAAQVDDPSRP
jgi:serpin B